MAIRLSSSEYSSKCRRWKKQKKTGKDSRRCTHELVLSQGPSSSAVVRGLAIHHVKEVEDPRQQKEQEDKGDEETGDEVNGKVE